MTQTQSALTPPDLAEHPQLATVELLRKTLELTRMALFAAHPELHADDYLPDAFGPEVEDAVHVIVTIDTLLPVLKAYQEVVQAGQDLDIPF